jgi:thiosulfate/3-mercaptopyruvate sulfurtransferase
VHNQQRIELMYTTIISAAQLQALQQSGAPLMVFDVSFELAQPEAGDTQYAEQHIAGAVRANLDHHLSAHGNASAMSGGRHPLPTREKFAAWLSSVGFHKHMQAVVYDRQGTMFCGRLWWMLRWCGHEAVAVLDGGLNAWQAAGGALRAGAEPAHPASHFALAGELSARVAIDFVASQMNRQGNTIIDARAAPRYRGEVEPLDPVAGHIPGALNRPFTSNFDERGFFKSAQVLHEEFQQLLGDTTQVIHHCGSGVSAVPNLIAMQLAGLDTGQLFAGSWSEWSRDPARPVAKG